ncbi:MAG: VWA domain-containing protein, partial [Acidimicrobiia bacterium]|nr:VWA domain-containing protein [Acidimicrobiia bacterium]
SQETFDEFMAKHGEFFPENPGTLDELLEVLARRSAAFSRFMASLSPDQLRELMELSDTLMDDLDLQFELDRLGHSLRAMAPDLMWDQPAEMDGPPIGLGEGLAAMEELSQLDELERALSQDYPGASLDDVDRESLAARLGEDAVRDLDKLRRLERALQEAGLVARSDGQLELTPRGVRKLGERALARVFEQIAVDQPGSHDATRAGGDGDLVGSTRPWQFGDSFRLDLRKTVHNAVIRQGPTDGRVQLAPQDFEIAEAERRTSVATVLLLDMSRSMPLRGHWIHAKRMALALHSLISMQFPEDHLSIVGFSDYARVMQPTDLAAVDWEPVYGTNMEHAFNLAGRLLSKQRGASKQVLLVTDGEPTAHLVGEDVFFQWPPVWETLDKTYREAMRLARSGVTMNIFMLEQEPGLLNFVDELAKLVNGRVFNLVSDDQLGEMIVRDYIKRR